MRLSPETGRVRMAQGQLDQILVNLVVNARDAMPNGGTITIESGNTELDATYVAQHLDVQPGPYVYLAVSDTGEGMDPETRDHAFEPFYTTKEQGKGTGLGLATIYGVMQQAGGQIWLYSEPGIGSSFKLYFPRERRADAGAHTPHARPARREPAGPCMVVEDEASVREMTTTVLRRAGYDVHPVASGAEAMQRLGELDAPIDVLVTDVVMPGMSGIELAEQVLDRYPAAGVVMLSGYTAETLDLERVVGRGGHLPVEAGPVRGAARGRRVVGATGARPGVAPAMTEPREPSASVLVVDDVDDLRRLITIALASRRVRRPGGRQRRSRDGDHRVARRSMSSSSTWACRTCPGRTWSAPCAPGRRR